ncbi:hypothetical protein [Saccharophagus degradans]|uniref:Uncharacterized protein n=1 Tax=Saccharophagus degradans (strain 2-40 / ATCC 43961 / DSM 17024) TaxID=203122 RepID=Q21N59_SACD2|nr:hypothetical protein [Saccharophagus degradans]ABD79870.1 hypothetical protein Sde_0606 [Saccharophagus degradans 2-40]
MVEKQIYDLESEDLRKHPVWYFPMDDSVEDELSVKPCGTDEISADYQVIIKTVFIDGEGKEYLGYIYWSDPDTLEDLKPVLFVNEEDCITFWNGMIKPSWDDYDAALQVMKDRFPITFRSDAIENLPSISGVLDGLYFISDDDSIQYI